jgi:Outer membrane protein Omp28
MKKPILFRLIYICLLCVAITSCDKVKNAYPAGTAINYGLDTSLYEGNFADYVAPVFTTNTNSNRNVLIEDYTGHKCIFCPAAAVVAKQIEEDPASGNRVFVASIHASPEPGGSGVFQEITTGDFSRDFTCVEGKTYGVDFGTGFGFSGNPRGTINRINPANNMFIGVSSWQARVTSLLTSNILKANLQAKTDYFPSTRGVYLHVELDPILPLPTNLKMVVYCVEDSLIAPQAKPSGVIDLNYVHRDIMRGTIDGLAYGRTLNDLILEPNGNLLLKYSYVLPIAYAPSNFHFLIYLMDGDTYEIIQVIKTKLD